MGRNLEVLFGFSATHTFTVYGSKLQYFLPFLCTVQATVKSTGERFHSILAAVERPFKEREGSNETSEIILWSGILKFGRNTSFIHSM